MATYAVTAVRLDPASVRVVKVRWALVSTETWEWGGAPMEEDVVQIINAIRRGDRVYTVFVEGTHTILGPRLRVVFHRDGHSGIEVERAAKSVRRTVKELPRF